MSIKNKIIKWLGGYTEEDAMNKSKVAITYSHVEKRLFPINIEFAVDANFYEDTKNSMSSEYELCHRIADFMFKHYLVEYTTSYDEVSNCYIMRAKAYVREP